LTGQAFLNYGDAPTEGGNYKLVGLLAYPSNFTFHNITDFMNNAGLANDIFNLYGDVRC
jgi:hypothetical protein